jgi:RNA polymerase primary sigma factor/RNA polymerase sigma factor
MYRDYAIPEICRLRDELVAASHRDELLACAMRAERLLDEIQPAQFYPCVQLIGRLAVASPATSHVPVSGEAVGHDLRRFVEDLSDAANLPAEDAGEPVHTIDELSKMLNVSTKTIARWREQGLVARRFLFEGRKRIGFLRSSVERFVARHRRQVDRAQRFHQMSPQERHEIVEHARRLARNGGRQSEVMQRVAQWMNRSVETVRYTLKRFDRDHPEQPVFTDHARHMSQEVKDRINLQHRQGTGIDALARRHERSPASIQRIINEARARRIFELPLDFIDSREFHQPRADAKILAATPPCDRPVKKVKPPKDFPPYLAALYETPLLTASQERHLFRKLNYLKYRAAQLRGQLDHARPKVAVMEEIESLYQQAVATKNQLIQANLRLVVSLARKRIGATNESFFELVSDGNMSLIRAVDKFDYSKGNKFSTYATWALIKNYARTIPSELKRQTRFRTSQDERLADFSDFRSDHTRDETEQDVRERQVSEILSCLSEREQKIIVSRYGLDYAREPRTLQEVGEELGVTKERVRQLEARALSKLRAAARDHRIDLSA